MPGIPETGPGDPRFSAAPGRAQSGIVSVLPENVIWFAAAGAAEIGGTFAVVIGLLTWINIQIRMILYAAELNSVMATGESAPAR